MTLNKSNLRIYLGVLIFALVVQPNYVPDGFNTKGLQKIVVQWSTVSWNESGGR